MRYIVTVAALILSYGTTAGYAEGTYTYGLGNHSCGKYLAAVHGHPPGRGNVINHPQKGQFSDDHYLYMHWLAGFLSATNWLALNEPNFIKNDGAAIDVWIRKWCEQNPTKPLFQAAEEFVRDQRKDQGQGWRAR
jgi:hypothetical protein